MKIELTILISIISCLSGLILGFSSFLRNSRNDEKEVVIAIARIESKINSIYEDLSEIKAERKELKKSLQLMEHRLSNLESESIHIKKDMEDLQEQMKIYEKECKDCRSNVDKKLEARERK